jgi:hypothetical protein
VRAAWTCIVALVACAWRSQEPPPEIPPPPWVVGVRRDAGGFWHEQKARVLWQFGLRDRAVEAAKTALGLSPRSHRMLRIVALHAFDAGSDAEALVLLNAYLRGRPEAEAAGDDAMLMRLGYVHLRRGHYDQAAWVLAPLSYDDTVLAFSARKGLCAAYCGMRRLEDAETLCNRVQEEADRRGLPDPSIAYNLSQVLGGKP